ncbi:Uncharacterized protein HZ326_20192 [Fusarium oxysporum f. sp. albedinis]|nr:Uncharacterized protein HZ326_20192 [Fusarium oxysporum f. sp. albedinis]
MHYIPGALTQHSERLPARSPCRTSRLENSSVKWKGRKQAILRNFNLLRGSQHCYQQVIDTPRISKQSRNDPYGIYLARWVPMDGWMDTLKEHRSSTDSSPSVVSTHIKSMLNRSIFVVGSMEKERMRTLELGAVAATLHRGRLDKPLRIGRRLNGSWLNRFSGSAPTNHKTYVPDAWRQWSKPPLILDPRQRAIPGYCEPPQSSQLSKDRP